MLRLLVIICSLLVHNSVSVEADARGELEMWEINIQRYVDSQRQKAPNLTFNINDY